MSRLNKKRKDKMVGVILARGSSRSIPKKNIIEFCGKPLIAWTILQARESKYLSGVYVSTDSQEIANISKNFGARIIKRPKSLATDFSSSEEVLIHALNIIEKKERIDLVVFLQATSPIRTSEDVDNAIKLFISKKADSLFSAAILEDFCVWKIENGILRSVTFDYKNRVRRQDRNPYYLENGSIYIFKPEILKQYNNRLGGKIVFYPMPLWKSYEIDNIEDIEICEYYVQNKILKKKTNTAINGQQ